MSLATPMWTCPKCGRMFANANQSHACGRYDLAHHFEGKPASIRALFESFRRMLEQFGPVVVLPEKTRIAFQVRMSFAQLTPKRNWIDGHLVPARRVDSPLFRKIETISRRNHVHHFRLATSADLSPALRELAHEAYRVGCQEHLGRREP